MSHYYSSCNGGRGKTTRAGHKTTGIHAMVRCHELSVYVTGEYDAETDEDTFKIHITLDEARAAFEGRKETNEQAAEPLCVKYKRAHHSVEVIHNVGIGDTHNVKSSQAAFSALADY
jgi:hypothetical protein